MLSFPIRNSPTFANKHPSLFSDQAGMIFGGLAGFENQTDGLTVDGKTEAVQTAFVTGNFFSMLGIVPLEGRLILPSEGKAPGADPVVVLGYRYWKTRFRSDPQIVGKKAAINGRPVTIVGVGPEGFDGITPLITMQAYLPLGMATLDSGGNTDFLTDPKITAWSSSLDGMGDERRQGTTRAERRWASACSSRINVPMS